MGTLYNCLREVRLEKYYPAFRANGITRCEALAHLTMAELCAMGVAGAHDRRRLVELVNIIKSVSRSEASSGSNSGGGGSGGGGSVPRKRHPNSPTPSSARSTALPAAAAGGNSNANSQSEKKVPRRRPRSPPGEGAGIGTPGAAPQPHGLRLEPTRDVSVRERGPNFSVGSYLDMLDFMSDSSHSDASGDRLESSDGEATPPPPPLPPPPPPPPAHSRPQPPPPTLSARNPPRKLASAERVRSQARSKGYNYGVPSGRDSAKPRARGGGGGGGGGGGAKVAKDDRIRVCVRKRPVSRRESRAADPDIIEAESTTTVLVTEPKVAVDLTAFTMKHEFVFDEVFDESCSNDDVYIRAARPLISTVFQGSNATFFAYGQTGAGKTHTMLGGGGVAGLYQLAAQDVFDIVASGQHGRDLHVWVSFFEIYCGQLFDLLNRRSRLVAREDGSQRVCIAGLTETEAPDVPTLIKILQFGNSVRSRGTSSVNPDSSRSHAVLQMEIRHADEAILGKISLIDLAGSERASDMGDPDRQTRMEGAEINQSLLALKECIRSIDQESRHTPFRQSKLTHILKDAFVGNSRTCMIANVSPVQSACEHTLNTLRYADRVKELRRDGGQSAGSASFGQAMTLLMNIPLTAPPSLFHPSHVLSSSTPVRPRLHDHNPPSPSPTPTAAADITLDPSETPIRGHNVFPKSAASAKPRSRPAPENHHPHHHHHHPPPSSAPGKQRLSSAGPRLPSAGGAAASQGAAPPPPEASPSESDHTDTDSNNVTHPTETRAAPSQPNIPVIASTDTDFDFPTSDFNNAEDDDDDLNDLSQARNDLSRAKAKARPAGREGQGHGQAAEDQSASSAACASGPRPEAPKGPSAERWVSNPSPTNQLSGRSSSSSRSQGSRQAAASPVPRQTKNSPLTVERVLASSKTPSSFSSSAARAALNDLANVPPVSSRNPPPPPFCAPVTGDSFDDELLFGGPEGGERSPPKWEPSPAGSGEGPPPVNRPLMKLLPGPQTALSSDLTSFSQRSPLKNGLEKTTSSPREVAVEGGAPPPLPPSYSNVSPSPRYEEGPSSGSKVPSPGRSSHLLPSPSCAAVRDWVAHKTDVDPGSGRSSARRRAEKASERTDTAPAPGGHLPFTAYSGPDPSLRNHHLPSAQDKGRAGSQTSLASDVADSAVRTTEAPAQGLSGPRSDPLTSNVTGFAHGAREGYASSSSLPTANSAVNSAAHSAANSAVSSAVYSAAFVSRPETGSADAGSRHSGSTDSLATGFAKPSTTSSALVTEKLMSGAVFSPIHPQPVSTPGVAPGLAAAMSSRGGGSSLLHPTPVCGPVPSVVSAPSVVASLSAPFSAAEREQARVWLVGRHEDQLAAVTSLCKQEMKLLLSAKRALPRSFDDYISRVNGVLAQKMSAIQQLQDNIRQYQARFVSPAPAPAPAAGASSNEGGAFPQT